MCEHDDELLEQAALGKLSPDDQARLDARLGVCASCRQRWADYREIVALLPRLANAERMVAQETSAVVAFAQRIRAPRRSLRLASSREIAAQPALSGHWNGGAARGRMTRMRGWRGLSQSLSSVVAVLLVAVLIAGFWYLAGGHGYLYGLGARPQQASPAATAPLHCAQGPAPKVIAPYWGPASGASPLWIIGFDGQRATMQLARAKETDGYVAKVIFAVEPGFATSITVAGKNLADNTPIRFQVGSSAATPTLVLDPAHPAISGLHGQWVEWPTSLYLPRAGCYALTATWSNHTALTVSFGADIQAPR
jgi:hypothetical protein